MAPGLADDLRPELETDAQEWQPHRAIVSLPHAVKHAVPLCAIGGALLWVVHCLNGAGVHAGAG